MSYSTINKTKWGICFNCGGGEQEVVKVAKNLYCIQCRNAQKAEQQIERSKRRVAARNVSSKLRRDNILGSQYSEDYEEAERAALIADLDFVHSRLVRMMAADKDGFALCFTCGKKSHWTLMQLSHFIKRKNTITRWDLKANRCACKNCNEVLDGNLEVFATKLNEEEKGLAERLTEMSREVYKWTRDELKQELISQRDKLKIVEQKFNKHDT